MQDIKAATPHRYHTSGGCCISLTQPECDSLKFVPSEIGPALDLLSQNSLPFLIMLSTTLPFCRPLDAGAGLISRNVKFALGTRDVHAGLITPGDDTEEVFTITKRKV